MKRVKLLLTSLVLLLCLSSNAFVFLAIPFAISGAQVLMAGAVAAAAAAGVVIVDQGSELLEKIKAQSPSEEEMAAASAESQNDFALALKKATGIVEHKSCETHTESSTGTCNSTPEVCCKDFLDKFRDHLHKNSGAFAFFKDAKRHKMVCCYEWDHQHGGFEIFDRHGNHLGERGCDDLNEDPCEYTASRGKHAQPNSTTHKPRSQLCSSH
ncbi:hypothetical protein [Bdellovibrio sp. HCB2-146]|uniref:hypothetical protein n=1 Tax=Bdellovibrio sp. HCB2-146 TaxID=3394362 RepID=UPI0039BCC604